MDGPEGSPSVRLGQHDDEGDSIERPGCHLMQSLDAFSGLCAPQNSVLCDRTHQANYGESSSTTEMSVIAAQPFTYVYYHVKRRAASEPEQAIKKTATVILREPWRGQGNDSHLVQSRSFASAQDGRRVRVCRTVRCSPGTRKNSLRAEGIRTSCRRIIINRHRALLLGPWTADYCVTHDVEATRVRPAEHDARPSGPCRSAPTPHLPLST